MKQYFVKYSPGEGETQVGDKVRSQSCSRHAVTVTSIEKDIVWTDELDNQDPTGISYFGIPKDKVQKLSKLYLCSRNIKPGDKVIYLKNGEERTVISDEMYMDEPDLPTAEWRKKPFCTMSVAVAEDIHVKLIGEVSAGAIWVVEGMEFDENDFKLEAFEALLGGQEFHIMDYESWLSCMADAKFVIFRCPTCKTFH